MTLILSGTDGLSDVDGSAATPAIRGTDANTGIFFPAADQVAITTGGTQRAVVDASGRVGIGTDSPATTLHLKAAVCNVRLEDADTSAYANVGVDNSGSMYLQADPANSQASSTMYFSVDGTERMRIDSSGSLTLPGKLYAGQYQGDGTNDFVVMSNNASKPIVFYTGVGGVSAVERARIDSSGNLLVGATSQYSDEKFNVTQSSAKSGITVRLSGGPYNNTSYAMIEGRDGTTVRFYFPSNGGLYNYSANNFNLASDLRLKKDIQSVQSYWNVFKSIEWKTWLYNDQTDEIKNIGVIAQELQALAPELVCESNALPTPEGESPYLGLWENDFKMAGMSVITELVKRCEEQQAIITQLQADVAVLKGTP